MIYFDNAATTFPKPQSVIDAVNKAFTEGASVGRSGHQLALNSAKIVYDARCAVADLFGFDKPENIIFTHNATDSLNIAIKALGKKNKKIAVSSFEHNSVIRPLNAIVDDDVSIAVLKGQGFESESIIESAKQAAEDGTKLFIINHVSNVFGYILPIKEIDKIAEECGAKMIIDASQSAGIVDIDIKEFKSVVAVCMPGHKSLYGPQGTGVLLINDDEIWDTIKQGGTGSTSADIMQPEFLPDRFESGTINYHGIAGLLEGVKFVSKMKPQNILKEERVLINYINDNLSKIHGTTIYLPEKEEERTGVLSFIHKDMPSESLADELSSYDVCTRAGLHCAPCAHRFMGTFSTGTVRLSMGVFNTLSECERFLEIYEFVVKKT